MRLVKTFKDEKRVYFLNEYVKGTDLFEIIEGAAYFNERSVKFYMSCLVMIIGHLHKRNIIYRDLKP